MKERPILFSSPMVRAIIEGRKTMTRRILKPTTAQDSWEHGDAFYPLPTCDRTREHLPILLKLCPYGQPGDRLWVRETFCPTVEGCDPPAVYRATFDEDRDLFQPYWKPSIHMPRKLSRILLDVTAVRVERVQDISEDDAIAEGVEGHNEPTGGDDYQDLWRDYSIKEEDNEGYNYFNNPRDSFRSLWDSINAKRGYGWDANPWVWVIEFRRIEP